jgi:2-iminobutanoate/2-iminopropanoate deaminase
MRMKKRSIKTENGPHPIGPYSKAIMVNGFIFVSGQTPLDPATGELVSGDVAAQTRQALRNIACILAAAGVSLEQVIKTTVFLTDMHDFTLMNEAYAHFFPHEPPARSTVGVLSLPRDARVEIEAIAETPDQ